MKLVRSLLAACAAAFVLGATAQAATFDQVNRQADNKLIIAVPATTQAAVQIDGTKKAPLVRVADYTPAQKPQQHAVVNYTRVDKAVDFMKHGLAKDGMGATKVFNGQQLSNGIVLAASSGYKRGLYGQDAGCVAA